MGNMMKTFIKKVVKKSKEELAKKVAEVVTILKKEDK